VSSAKRRLHEPHRRTALDAHWLERSARDGTSRPLEVETRSLFLPMRDGTRIAVDLHLPKHVAAGARLPTIVRMTRYLRSLAHKNRVAGWLDVAKTFDIYSDLRPRFLEAGYAWVDVDVRGTGASTGTWTAPWHADQVRDSAEIVDWIVKQPWSTGKVGSLGISYDGTAAEMLLVAKHPAVLAVAPLFSLYDVYADVAFPGGIHLAWFTEAWGRYNAALDRNAFHEAFATPIHLVARVAANDPAPRGADRLSAWLGRRDKQLFTEVTERLLGAAIRGVRDVERPCDGTPDARALADREMNLDVHGVARKVIHRDDVGADPRHPDLTIDSFSPHHHASELGASGAAIYSYSGWRDGAYPHSAIKRHVGLGTQGSRLTLGPWAHTGRLAIHAFETGRPSEFDHAGELIGFFDEHLCGRPSPGDAQPVHYFTTGEERWKAAASWPPPGFEAQALHLGSAGQLRNAPVGAPHRAAHRIDASIGSGERSRWRSLLSMVPGDYPDRRERDARLLVWESAELARPLEVTGHAELVLHASFDRGPDGQVFAYLEDVAPDGSINYVTEGQLRARHRARSASATYLTPGVPRSYEARDARELEDDEIVELAVCLLPCSHLFRLGHRIRIAVGCADADHFAPPPGRATTLSIHMGPASPSRLVLPCSAPLHTRPSSSR
jgi:uncharacterized protein